MHISPAGLLFSPYSIKHNSNRQLPRNACRTLIFWRPAAIADHAASRDNHASRDPVIQVESIFVVVDMDRVVPDIAYEIGVASRDAPHEGAAVYTEVYGMVLLKVIQALVLALTCFHIIFVGAAYFLKTVCVRQMVYFDVGQIVEVIQGSDTLPCDQPSCYVRNAGPVMLFHNLCLLTRTS
ncbi:MAG: hypothetical protein H6Q93_840 [Nitrospirae bacterium]|nr:hypothetical protein [Nitrospirota bacterium]